MVNVRVSGKLPGFPEKNFNEFHKVENKLEFSPNYSSDMNAYFKSSLIYELALSRTIHKDGFGICTDVTKRNPATEWLS